MSDTNNPGQASQLIIDYLMHWITAVDLVDKHHVTGCSSFFDENNIEKFVDIANNLSGHSVALSDASEIATAELAAWLPLTNLQEREDRQSDESGTMDEIVTDSRAADLGRVLGQEKAAAFLEHQAQQKTQQLLEDGSAGPSDQTIAAETAHVDALGAAFKDGRWLAWKDARRGALNSHVIDWSNGLHEGKDNSTLVGYEVPTRSGVVACVWQNGDGLQSCGLFGYDGHLVSKLW